MIIVCGTYKGGTSATAGLLHRMGVCMGHNLKDVDNYCTHEDWSIRNACVECYGEPSLTPRVDFPDRVRILREWYKSRPCGCRTIGVKYPSLCLMGQEMRAAWGDDHRYIIVTRPQEASVASLTRWWPMDAPRMVRDLCLGRDGIRHAAGLHAFTVSYDVMCHHPLATARILNHWLNLKASDDQIQEAAAFVDRRAVMV